MIDIDYSIQKTTQVHIYAHLVKSDSDFTPHLSSEVPLDEFSRKIFKYSIRFEAWVSNELIGLLSIYLNDTESRNGFINHISVLQMYKGYGISKVLLENCFEYANKNGFESIRLEVSIDNKVAKKLYKKYDFVVEKKKQHKVQMLKNLNVGEIK